MAHVTVARSRRHDRARAALPIRPVASQPLQAQAGDPAPLLTVSAQVVIGFLAPLPVIQLGHWLLGWPSILVMFGGQ
ncbi:hypothetical protein [Sphingomonas sp. BK235]|uniref:hypothetical protein n=1 Tax=Sphingomonas sp. BK235 TaxID=2512131 RepID=UPI00104C7314|nr:hypothetical protein [Sphingomonas sp. BK235]TCP30724.1 hypothetical protein EV292_11281 [Sphingomonas sp. BK235]